MPKCPFCGKNEINGLQLENHISLKHSEKLLEIQTNLQRNMKGDEKLKVKVQIVVDGNNVAYFVGIPKLRNLKIMRSYLVKKNFNPIIFVSSALKYQIDHPTELLRFINIYNIIEVEGGIDDDKHLIEEAFRKKIKIISNDKFNEYLNDYNGKSWELKKNILGFTILDGKIILIEK
ncbi:MAG: hypothetical protein VW886_02695 [Candidatus Heimdallarchaeota archaeon]